MSSAFLRTGATSQNTLQFKSVSLKVCCFCCLFFAFTLYLLDICLNSFWVHLWYAALRLYSYKKQIKHNIYDVGTIHVGNTEWVILDLKCLCSFNLNLFDVHFAQIVFSVYVSFLFKTENDTYCKAEDEWENTKADFTSKLKCNNAAGDRERKCK